VTGVHHFWNDLNTPPDPNYTTTKIVGATADYSHPLGLKESTTFWEEASGAWSADRTEYYSYDSSTDWLTGVDYNDGLSNEVTTWGYDVAGNRTSDSANSGTWTYDNLNRMSASPFGTYTNDILGNRTQFNTSGDDPTYKWDELNRMVEFKSAVTWPKSSYVQYQYRADGMRVKKFNNWVDPDETTLYFYDGQMPIADYWTDGTDTLLTKYGVGARGIDVITKVANGGSETFGYPIYDTHGNMVATLARNGSGYTLGNQQSYDVWGSVRSGSSSEEQGYVANLGHRADPESFLTYMRARYYEPMSGRFISQDRACDGFNWYAYAENSPVVRHDGTGNWASEAADWFFLGGLLFAVVSFFALFHGLTGGSAFALKVAIHTAKIAVMFFTMGLGSEATKLLGGGTGAEVGVGVGTGFLSMYGTDLLMSYLEKMKGMGRMAASSHATIVVLLAWTYGLAVIGALNGIEVDAESYP
jgi:RHS repeat-associated protein